MAHLLGGRMKHAHRPYLAGLDLWRFEYWIFGVFFRYDEVFFRYDEVFFRFDPALALELIIGIFRNRAQSLVDSSLDSVGPLGWHQELIII